MRTKTMADIDRQVSRLYLATRYDYPERWDRVLTFYLGVIRRINERVDAEVAKALEKVPPEQGQMTEIYLREALNRRPMAVEEYKPIN